jgi:multidrug efflux pump subunit AcrA (membrane-fusion protein)
VVRIDRVIDPASGTFAVRMELPNPEHAIPSGLHCQVRFLGADAPPAAAAP